METVVIAAELLTVVWFALFVIMLAGFRRQAADHPTKPLGLPARSLLSWTRLAFVIGLPLLAAIFMAVHFWRIRRDGGLARPL